MSFQRRILLIVSACLILLLAGNSIVSVFNARSYFSNQMQSLASDTATSLGLTISTAAKQSDVVQVQSMVDAIFDSGYYSSITYIDLEGKVLVSRAREMEIDGVPAWFASLINIPRQTGAAEVVSGWYQLGEVHVVSHPGFAYADLWRSVVEYLWLFLFTAVLAYGLVGLLLKALTEPLRRLERHAESIAHEDFRVETDLPASIEFRRVFEMMNHMALKVQQTFKRQLELTESLRREAHMDKLTELPNRGDFDARLTAWLSSESGGAPSTLMLVKIKQLEQINDEDGRESADQLIADVADALKALLAKWPSIIIGRRSGAEFSVFVPGLYGDEIQTLITELKAKIDTLNSVLPMHRPPCLYGIAQASENCSLEQLLSCADASLRQADREGQDFFITQLGDSPELIRPARQWLPILENAIESDALQLHFQPVFLTGKEAPDHFEVLARLREGDEFAHAGLFWPLVERFGLSELLDRRVVEQSLELLASREDLKLSVNISTSTALKPEFILWLKECLAEVEAAARARLIIEVPEVLLKHSVTILQPLVNVIQDTGVRLSLDRFGMMPTSLAYLQGLPLDYVKLDRRFVVNIDDNRENRFYVRTLVNIARDCGITFLVEGVEKETELSAVHELGVDGVQGFFVGKPSASLF